MENNESNEQTTNVQDNNTNVNQNTDAEVIVESETNTVQENNVNQNTDAEVTVESETNTTVEQNNVKQKSSKKLLIIIIIVLVLVILGLVGYIEKDKIEEFIDSYKNKNQEKPIETVDDEDEDEGEDEESSSEITESTGGVSKPYTISFCYSDDGFWKTRSRDCDNIVNVETLLDISEADMYFVDKNTGGNIEAYYESTIHVEDHYKNKYLLLSDYDYVYLYIREEDKSYRIFNFHTVGYINYKLIIDKTSEELLGATDSFHYTGDPNKTKFYSAKEKKIIYEDYDSIEQIYGNHLLMGKKEGKIMILSPYESKVISEVTSKGDEIIKLDLSEKNNDYYALISGIETATKVNKIYNSNLTEIISFDYDVPLYYNISINSENQVQVINGNKIDVYDINGSLVKTSASYDEVFELIGDYIVAVNNEKLILTTIDEEAKNITDWWKGKDYNKDGSYWDSDKQEIVLSFTDNSVSIDDILNSCVDCTKENLEYAKNVYSCTYGYRYFYNTKTDKITRKPSLICPYLG